MAEKKEKPEPQAGIPPESVDVETVDVPEELPLWKLNEMSRKAARDRKTAAEEGK